MTSTLPSALLSRVLDLTQRLPYSQLLHSLHSLRTTMGAAWSDSIDASITIDADPELVLSLLQAAANDPLYANPNICSTPRSSPPPSPTHSRAPSSPHSPTKPAPSSPTTHYAPLHSSTVHLLLPYLLDDTHTFRLATTLDGQVTLEQRELLSGVVVWLGRVCRMRWYTDMLEETRSGYEQWNEAIKRMAEEQHEQQRMALEAH